MAMPKKGSRKIVVDNVTYRWKFGGAWILIEAVRDSGPTRILDVDTSVRDRDYWLTGEEQKTIILPGAVEQYIRIGLDKGWNPHQAGPPLSIVVAKEVTAAISRKKRWQ